MNAARITRCLRGGSVAAIGVVTSHVLGLSAFAQTGGIAGKVIDATTQQPIENAIVSIAGSTLAATTLSNGAFTILGVPPGFYTVAARRFGFAGRAFSHVEVQIGRERLLTYYLRPSSSDSVEVTEADPLFLDPKSSSSYLSLNHDQIASLPSLTLAGGLGLNGGYLRLQRSATTISLSEFRRGVTGLSSVRGARPEATLYLLEGFDISNPVYGTPPLLIEPLAAASLSFSPAHVDAEHGGAVSGLVNQAIREGIDRITGAFEYQTTAIAAALGAKANDVSHARAIRGSLSGPVPFTGNAVRFSAAGHLLGDRLSVVKPTGADWTGFGDYASDQVVAKLSYTIRPKLRLSIAGVGQRRTIADVDPNFIRGDSVAPAMTRDDGAFVVGRVEKRFERSVFSVALASNKGTRRTCSFWQGVCVEDRLQRIPQAEEVPFFAPPPRQTQYAVSGAYFGGESFQTDAIRADGVIQAGDQHQVRVGFYGARHHISYQDAVSYRWVQGDIKILRDVYRVRPVEFASYVQDAISHDLITLHIGMRFDYGNNGGFGFTNPRIPTNGTTAREVCNGEVPGINEVPFTYGGERGIVACLDSPDMGSGRPFLLDSAMHLAQTDDFRKVAARGAFSPRIGISLPITETSGMFINIGRFNRNPLYHDAFRYSGTGSRPGMEDGGDRICESSGRLPGSNQCVPTFKLDSLLPEFVGNPNLPFETASNWEAGFTTEAGRWHSFEASFFSISQSNLPMVVTQQQEPDFGVTYGPIGDRFVKTILGNGAYAALGASFTLRRRLQNGYSYAINYSWQRSDEIGGRPERPDLAAQALVSQLAPIDSVVEATTSRSRPHVVNAQFSVEWRDNVPRAFGRVGKILFHNSKAVVTFAAASGGLMSVGASRAATQSSAITNLVDLMYARTFGTGGLQWSLVTRVQNLLDVDDGARDLNSLRVFSAAPRSPRAQIDDVLSRRILTGIALRF